MGFSLPRGCEFQIVPDLIGVLPQRLHLLRSPTNKDWKINNHMAVGQNLVPLVNIKIAGKWVFIPLKMVLIGIDS